MAALPRFLYLNLYSFLLVLAGASALALPLYRISMWILIAQAIAALCLFSTAAKLFATWDDKKRKIDILLCKNRAEFRPDTFEVFMQAPCGRLVARAVLSDLGRSDEYGNLLKLKKPVLTALRENCAPTKTIIYINEKALSG